MKTLLIIMSLVFSSIASNNNSHVPFSSPVAMEWYKKFISQYEIPVINFPQRKIKIAIIDTGYSSPFNTESYIDNVDGYTESHGTHITGIIYAINPEAEIYSFNVYQNRENSSLTISKTAQAIKKAIELKIDLINISMSGGNTSIEELEAFEEAEKAGIIIVTAAGNHNEELSSIHCQVYPACHKQNFSNIIVVGNLMNRFLKNPSSNFGEMVDLSFNGTSIESLDPKQGLAYQTGTSQATAFITGLLSLSLSQTQKLSILETKELLMTQVGKAQKRAGLMRVHQSTKRSIASIK